jgi:hypothetical protein
MWKDKHVVMAMIVAPILAIFAWVGVDYIVAEKAQPAEPGSMYPLVARSNCRYDSGSCDLVNNDFEVTLRPIDLRSDRTILAVESKFELQQTSLALVVDGEETAGKGAPTETPDGETVWIVNIPVRAEPEAILRVAVTAQDSVYFIEGPVTWMWPGRLEP